MGVSERASIARTRSSRTCSISSRTECPVASRKRRSKCFRLPRKRDDSLAAVSPSHASWRICSIASRMRFSRRPRPRVDLRRTAISGATRASPSSGGVEAGTPAQSSSRRFAAWKPAFSKSIWRLDSVGSDVSQTAGSLSTPRSVKSCGMTRPAAVAAAETTAEVSSFTANTAQLRGSAESHAARRLDSVAACLSARSRNSNAWHFEPDLETSSANAAWRVTDQCRGPRQYPTKTMRAKRGHVGASGQLRNTTGRRANMRCGRSTGRSLPSTTKPTVSPLLRYVLRRRSYHSATSTSQPRAEA